MNAVQVRQERRSEALQRSSLAEDNAYARAKMLESARGHLDVEGECILLRRCAMSQSHIQEQIELIARHEQEFLEQRTTAERVSDVIAGFIGSLPFVAVHLCIFAAWIVINLLPHARHFDPKPFGLLQTCVAMEAILAASFILMRQAGF